MEIQPIQILLQIINFGLVAFFLIKFLYRPIAKVLEARTEKIKQGMDAAEKNIADQSKLEAYVKSEQAKARKDAQKILTDAKKQAEEEAAQIIATAKEQAKKASATEAEAGASLIVEAQKKAEQNLKQLVAATTAKVLEAGLSEADQRKIIDSQINQLKTIKFV